MPIRTEKLHTDDAGSAFVTVPPCFYAGCDVPTASVVASVGGDVGPGPYDAGSMPFIADTLAVGSEPDTDVRLFINLHL